MGGDDAGSIAHHATTFEMTDEDTMAGLRASL